MSVYLIESADAITWAAMTYDTKKTQTTKSTRPSALPELESNSGLANPEDQLSPVTTCVVSPGGRVRGDAHLIQCFCFAYARPTPTPDTRACQPVLISRMFCDAVGL